MAGFTCRPFCHPARRWRAHGAIGVQRPWISCCSNVGNNRESVGDGGHGSGTVSGGNGSGVGGGGIWLEVKQESIGDDSHSFMSGPFLR